MTVLVLKATGGEAIQAESESGQSLIMAPEAGVAEPLEDGPGARVARAVAVHADVVERHALGEFQVALALLVEAEEDMTDEVLAELHHQAGLQELRQREQAVAVRIQGVEELGRFRFERSGKLLVVNLGYLAQLLECDRHSQEVYEMI